MVQRPKDSVRRAILEAAASEFARVGFAKTTLATVAEKAGTSIGNLYKYYSNKDALFDAVVPQALVRKLRALLRARIEALGKERDIGALPSGHAYEQVSEELLEFAVAHRSELLFLLTSAEGTAYASFSEDLVRDLTRLAVGYAARAYPSCELSPSRKRALTRIYRAFVASIAAIVRDETTPRALRDATGHLTTYHLAGLRAFFEAAMQPEASAQ
jgi:AcrR family transcriptional regulator